jgi:uncharacterized membrane protein YhhN
LIDPALALSVLALVSAVNTILADYRGQWRLVYVFKPMTLALLIALAAMAKPSYVQTYKYFILAGLVSSLAGDVFLMLRNKRFAEGLACFLVAHLFYIAALLQTMPLQLSFGTALPLILYALFMMRILFPYLGRMKTPVVLYILVITAMAGLSAERFIEGGGTNAFFAFLGAILFVISDSALAVNRFAKKFRLAQALILSTYFAGQWFIAMSV